MKVLRLRYAIVFLFSLAFLPVEAQSPRNSVASANVDISPDQPIRVDVDIVNLYCAVRNKQNGLVSSLEKEDFTLAEDSKPQTIKYFTRETDLPLTIGLLVDVSNSQRNLIEIERHAAASFF
jgi:hypothetical protein